MIEQDLDPKSYMSTRNMNKIAQGSKDIKKQEDQGTEVQNQKGKKGKKGKKRPTYKLNMRRKNKAGQAVKSLKVQERIGAGADQGADGNPKKQAPAATMKQPASSLGQ